MRSVPKVITATTLITGLAILSSPTQAAVPLDPALELLEEIHIAEETSMDSYAPESWAPKGWEEVYSSGCTVLQDILIRDTWEASQKLDDDCTLLVGTAIDPYSGVSLEYDRPEDVDLGPFAVDHVVSIGEAHRSGGSDWSAGRQLTFYHDRENLVAVSAVEHQAKAGADINEYLPPHSAVRCAYVATTVYVKHKHELTMDQAEHDVARSVLSDAQCETAMAQPAANLSDVAHNAELENGPLGWAQDNPGVVVAAIAGLVAVALLSGWTLQRKRRSAEKS